MRRRIVPILIAPHECGLPRSSRAPNAAPPAPAERSGGIRGSLDGPGGAVPALGQRRVPVGRGRHGPGTAAGVADRHAEPGTGARDRRQGEILRGRRWPGNPLRLLLAAPYLVFALQPALPIAVAAVVLASVGYSASLLLQHRLMALTPEELSGHALGLHSSGMLAMQGIGAAVAGAVAEQTSPGTAMAVMAAISVIVTLILAPGLRPDRVPPRKPKSVVTATANGGAALGEVNAACRSSIVSRSARRPGSTARRGRLPHPG